MADGHVIIGTEIDDAGLKKGLDGIKKDAKKAFDGVAKSNDRATDDIQKQSKETRDKIKDDQKETEESSKKHSEGTKNHWKTALSGIGKVGGMALKGTVAAIGAVGTAVAGVGAMAVNYNASMEQYATSFEVMTGSAEKAGEVMENLKELGAKTPFEFPELAQTTQLLMNYGFSADDAQEKLMMLGDISQGSAEKMQRVATAYGQMSSAGKVQLEDIKQMIEFCHAV